nr:RNA-directed DNA polymerase, eukaryota [Tanacetum cinerariifolium]
MESIDLLSVSACWGNLMFDSVHSDSVGNSGEILCMWDLNSFCKSSFTRSDYFVIIRGLWLNSGIKLMIVVVYAPQEASEKCLNEVHLGGSAFTWCHKSTTKMSKLDRFLVSENLLHSCPNINAISLDRYISDHRPILLRKAIFDYGPISFQFYNYWLEVDGFDKLVREAWNDAPGNKKNAIQNFMYKLKYTKEKIQGWLSTYRLNSRGALAKLKEDLRMFDEAIDKGNSPVEMVHKRLETLNKIQLVNNTHMSEVAQKAKIKWVVEGDENTKFFHGMLNKKRNQRSIRGIMVNGTWIDDPDNINTRMEIRRKSRIRKQFNQNNQAMSFKK